MARVSLEAEAFISIDTEPEDLVAANAGAGRAVYDDDGLTRRELDQLVGLRRWAATLGPRRGYGTAQLLSCAVPIALAWIGMLWSGLEHPVLTLSLAVACGLVMVRLFGILHDLAHASVFRARWLNEVVGVVVGLLLLTPYHRWRRDHGRHHGTVGNLDRRGPGDVPLLTLDEYRRAPLRQRLRYRVFRWPPFTYVGGGLVLFLWLHRRGSPRETSWRERLGVHLSTLLGAAMLLAAYDALGGGLFLLTVVPAYVVMCTCVMWLFEVQHMFPGAYLRRAGQWSYLRGCLEGASYYRLPPLLRWLSANTGYHHLHHLFPHVPNYDLPRCQQMLDQLEVGRRVEPVDLRASLGIVRWALYDEPRRCFVPWPRPSARGPEST